MLFASRVKAIDNREWNFQMQQYNDQIHMEKAQLKAARDIELAQTRAARDIAVAWAKTNQKLSIRFTGGKQHFFSHLCMNTKEVACCDYLLRATSSIWDAITLLQHCIVS